jgi:hypothetical protein
VLTSTGCMVCSSNVSPCRPESAKGNELMRGGGLHTDIQLVVMALLVSDDKYQPRRDSYWAEMAIVDWNPRIQLHRVCLRRFR